MLGNERELEVFGRAIAMPAEDGQSLIAREYSADAGVRERLLQLLAAHGRAETGEHKLVREAPGAERLPRRIGDYMLLELMGEGPTARTYLAEQTSPLQRRIALKVLKSELGRAQIVARLEADLRALKKMDHPSIAHIYAAGETGEGFPYLATELVEGKAIDRYCDDARLGIEARLKLFWSVCSAVQHAHQKGVIHRNLKPDNVLVTTENGTPVARIVDFGIARATDLWLTDAGAHSSLGYLHGSPDYMSPEQAIRSPIGLDTRTDIYSLGAILYRLLTGVRPIEFASDTDDGEIRHTFSTTAPEPLHVRLRSFDEQDLQRIALLRASTPRQLKRHLGREPDWICCRALARDPAERYQTAAEMADDIDKLLNFRPLTAGPNNRAYLARQFALRNRAAVAVGAMVLMTLLAGLTITSASLFRANRDLSIAESVLSDALAGRLNFANPELETFPERLAAVYESEELTDTTD